MDVYNELYGNVPAETKAKLDAVYLAGPEIFLRKKLKKIAHIINKYFNNILNHYSDSKTKLSYKKDKFLSVKFLNMVNTPIKVINAYVMCHSDIYDLISKDLPFWYIDSYTNNQLESMISSFKNNLLKLIMEMEEHNISLKI